MIQVGNDDDFVGLQPIALEVEPEREVANEGGTFVVAASEARTQEVEIT